MIDESKLGMSTIYKLVIGGAILLLLLMTFLPTPYTATENDLQAALAFPGVAGRHILGGDDLGRDVLSRMMVGGRFLVFRLVVVGVLVAGVSLLVGRRISRGGNRRWPSKTGLVLLVSAGLTVSVLSEIILGLTSGPPAASGNLFFRYVGLIGQILIGVPREPPDPSWGQMVVTGLRNATRAPWLLLFPLAGLVLVAGGIVALGSGIVDVVKQRARKA